MLGLCKQNELAATITKARKSSRWKAMQENVDENKETASSSLKYGLVRKEDHIEKDAAIIDDSDVNSLFQKIATPEER